MNRKLTFFIVLIALTLVIAAQAAAPPYHDVRPGYGLTRSGWLSDYCPQLKGTNGDTMVYCLDSGNPGMDVLVIGGTHANEISGILATTLLVERAEVKTGRLFVIPHANNSASMTADTRGGGNLTKVQIQSLTGSRIFAYGDRYTRVEDQPDFAKDPLGMESRNLNRVYPGKADGTLTQKIAYGLMKLIEQEGIDTAIDLHEANPTSTLAWTIVSPNETMDAAVLTAFELDERGIRMNPDRSGPGFAGYSHWEWSRLGAAAFLLETVNPGMESGKRADPVISDEYPIEKRVGIQLETIACLIKYQAEFTGRGFKMEGVPSYADLMKQGLKSYLR
jgi:predicted deacylase